MEKSMRWIKLAKHKSNREIHINVEHISSLEESKDGACTTVWFSADSPDGRQVVSATPEEILSKIEDAPHI